MVLWVIVTYIWGARVFNFINNLMSFTELHTRVQVTWFLYRHFPIYAIVSEVPAGSRNSIYIWSNVHAYKGVSR
jgi:hypothetical protein